ncbi:hypothetical protein D3C72_2178260 [compost metagenome]
MVMAYSTPNHNSSKPSSRTMGRNTGTVSRMIPNSSSTVPRNTSNSIMAARMSQRFTSSPWMNCSSVSAPPSPVKMAT